MLNIVARNKQHLVPDTICNHKNQFKKTTLCFVTLIYLLNHFTLNREKIFTCLHVIIMLLRVFSSCNVGTMVIWYVRCCCRPHGSVSPSTVNVVVDFLLAGLN